MASVMYDYIQESPAVLARIIARRAEICQDLVDRLGDADIEQIYIVGSGTSFHAGVSAQPFLEELTAWPVVPMHPARFVREAARANPRSLVIGVSQGGQSLSTVEGLRAAAACHLRRAALSANRAALVFEHAEARVALEVGDEACGAKTKGYCGSVATLMVMGAALARARGMVADERLDAYFDRMGDAIVNMPAVIEASAAWYDRISADLREARRILVVGYDGTYGDVLEGALKILETVRCGVEGYDIEEFFHGIYNSISEESHLFLLAPRGAYKARAQTLAEILRAWTPHIHLIADPADVADGRRADLLTSLTDDPLFSCWEYILPLQIVACRAARDRGIDPSIPKDPLFHQRVGSKQLG